MDGWCSDGANCFALVRYVPEPLASFLDKLRAEISPGCNLRAHLTVLPPRPLDIDPEGAWKEIRQRFQTLAPFIVELEQVRVFEVTEVVYLSVGAGMHELRRLHQRLNQGRAIFAEPYKYHPHITLGQELPAEQLAWVIDLAGHRWREYSGPRQFSVDRLTFVQNQAGRGWSDLAESELRPPVLA